MKSNILFIFKILKNENFENQNNFYLKLYIIEVGRIRINSF